MSDRYEAMANRNFFAELLALRDDQRRSMADAEKLIEGDRIPWEITPHGFLKWYAAPTMNDIVLHTLIIYLQRIPPGSRSGKQRTQGDQVGFVWRGDKGHTVVDGARHDWGKWDVIQVPIRTPGVEVQHFNDGETDVEILFVSYNSTMSCTVDRGSGFEQIDACPEWIEESAGHG